MSRDELIDVLANLVFVVSRAKRDARKSKDADDLMSSTATSIICLISLYEGSDCVDFHRGEAFDMILHESWNNNSSLDDLKQSFRKILANNHVISYGE